VPGADAPLLSDPDDIARLREARSAARVRADKEQRSVIFSNGETEVVDVAFRETLPFEDEHGLIEIPEK